MRSLRHLVAGENQPVPVKPASTCYGKQQENYADFYQTIICALRSRRFVRSEIANTLFNKEINAIPESNGSDNTEIECKKYGTPQEAIASKNR